MLRLVNLRGQVIRNVQRFNRSLENLKDATNKFETRIKGTVVENWVKYWKTVFNDYHDVARDVTTNVREKPLKAAVIMSGLAFLVASAKCNPSFTDFRDQYIKWSNRMILVHPNVQNNEALQHLRFTEICHNQLQIRRLNLIIGSIIWRDDSSSLTKTYDANCPYLQVQYSKFKDRILDIGFFNRWWILEVIVQTYIVQFSVVASFFKDWIYEQTLQMESIPFVKFDSLVQVVVLRRNVVTNMTE